MPEKLSYNKWVKFAGEKLPKFYKKIYNRMVEDREYHGKYIYCSLLPIESETGKVYKGREIHILYDNPDTMDGQYYGYCAKIGNRKINDINEAFGWIENGSDILSNYIAYLLDINLQAENIRAQDIPVLTDKLPRRNFVISFERNGYRYEVMSNDNEIHEMEKLEED